MQFVEFKIYYLREKKMYANSPRFLDKCACKFQQVVTVKALILKALQFLIMTVLSFCSMFCSVNNENDK